jgi:hypothetical protein
MACKWAANKRIKMNQESIQSISARNDFQARNPSFSEALAKRRPADPCTRSTCQKLFPE